MAPRSPAAALVPSPARLPCSAASRRLAHAPASAPLRCAIAGRHVSRVCHHPEAALLHVLPGASSPRLLRTTLPNPPCVSAARFRGLASSAPGRHPNPPLCLRLLTGASFAQVYLEIVKAAIEKKELRDGTAFKMMPFECSSNGLPPLALLPLPLEPRHLTLHPTRWHPGMHGNYQWTKLQARLDKIHAQLMLEVQDWRAQGTQQTALRKRGADSAVNSCVDYLAQQQERIDHEAPEGVSVGVDEANVCVWVATIFGPAAGVTVPHSAAVLVRPLLPAGARPRRAWGLLCALGGVP